MQTLFVNYINIHVNIQSNVLYVQGVSYSSSLRSQKRDTRSVKSLKISKNFRKDRISAILFLVCEVKLLLARRV